MSLKKLINKNFLGCAVALIALGSLESCNHDSREEMYDDLYYSEGRSAHMPAPGSIGEFVLIAGDRVHYGFDEFRISHDYKETIQNQAEFLKTYQDKQVTIAGHCDKRGTREYNIALGMRRAEAHKNGLISNGIDPDRIKTVSYGKERPLAEGDSESIYAKNRATVVHLH